MLGVDPITVGTWRRRFIEERVEGLRDAPRSGAPRTVDDARVEAVVTRTLETPAAGGHALEHAWHGTGERPVEGDGAQDLAGLRPAAASHGKL